MSFAAGRGGFTIDYLRFTIGVKNAGKFGVEKGAILARLRFRTSPRSSFHYEKLGDFGGRQQKGNGIHD